MTTSVDSGVVSQPNGPTKSAGPLQVRNRSFNNSFTSHVRDRASQFDAFNSSAQAAQVSC